MQYQLWREVAQELGVVSTAASFMTKKAYETYLYDFEQCHYFSGVCEILEESPKDKFKTMERGMLYYVVISIFLFCFCFLLFVSIQ